MSSCLSLSQLYAMRFGSYLEPLAEGSLTNSLYIMAADGIHKNGQKIAGGAVEGWTVAELAREIADD